MSIGFSTTFGVGSTDRITNSSFSMPTGEFTFSVMVNRNGNGGSSLGRAYEVGTNGFFLYYNSTLANWAIALSYDGVLKNWNVNSPFETPGDSWFNITVTFNRNTTGQPLLCGLVELNILLL